MPEPSEPDSSPICTFSTGFLLSPRSVGHTHTQLVPNPAALSVVLGHTRHVRLSTNLTDFNGNFLNLIKYPLHDVTKSSVKLVLLFRGICGI